MCVFIKGRPSKLILKYTGHLVGFIIAGFPFECLEDLINILIYYSW